MYPLKFDDRLPVSIRFVAVQTSRRTTMRRLPTNTPHEHIYLRTVGHRHSCALVLQWNHYVYTRIQKETGTACDTLRMLLENNTDPSMTDDPGFTPKAHAIPEERLDALKILEQLGH